jgi:hypothetical protein
MALTDIKPGALYHSRRDPSHLYRITDVRGQKVTAELVTVVDGAAAPAAEPVELSLGRARGSFVPVDELAAEGNTERQTEIMRGVAAMRRAIERPGEVIQP